MKYAYVATNLLDLWSEPRFNSERASQLFFSEIVKLGEVYKGYVRVHQLDGYTGWVDQRFLQPLTGSQASAYQKSKGHVLTSLRATVLNARGSASLSPHFLFYGTKVIVRSTKRSRRLPPAGQSHCTSQTARTGVYQPKSRFQGHWGGCHKRGPPVSRCAVSLGRDFPVRI